MTKRLYQLLALLAVLFISVSAQATSISRFARFTGNYNYAVTGGSLRTQPNSIDPCAIGTSNTQSLSGIPAGATIVAAYLYWGGSGSAADNSVSLNGSTIIADRTFATTPTASGSPFFGAAADVTSRVSGNGLFTFGNLTVDSSNTYCGNSTVMASWSLVVIYGSSSQPLRAINIFDGLDWFQNSSLTLTPDGFRIPASGVDGQMTTITWEGDPDLGGASEVLTFNGSTLDSQGYDSNSHFVAGGAGVTTNGTDVDTYNVSSLVSPGQTSATTFYSAGQDLVFLAAQIVSVTSTPQVDLSITKTHSGNFTVGTNATYTLHVANAAGVEQVDYLTTVTDTLPAGLSFVSGVGTGWTCGASGQTVTCTHPSPLAAGNAFPDITLTVAVGNAAYPSVSNTATVQTAGSNDFTPGNNSATDVATVNGSNLSSSTKTVSDLNGGEANVGDTLRYTITLINSTAVAASGTSVTDNVPGNVSGFNVVGIPVGASNASTGAGTGTNNTGLLNIGNITVPANGSVTIVFDVTVAAGTSPGATIDNTATVTNPSGPGATPSAPQIVVSPSLVPGSGNKQLYLWSSPGQTLSRTRPTGTHNAVTITGGNNAIWTITPVLQKNLTLRGGIAPAGSFPVYLWVQNTNSSTGNARSVTVTLFNGATSLATITQNVPGGTIVPTLLSFTLNLPANVVVNAGSTLSLRISNGASSGRWIQVTPYIGTSYSRIELNSLTVINVDSVQTYNAAYAGGALTTGFNVGSTAYIRAVVSDPFGSFDISSATITLRNPSGTDVVTAAAMTQVNDSGAATKTYEYAYAVPSNAPAGVWTARVTANEGVEGINDLGVGTFTVSAMPTLLVSKISEIVSDPVNNTTNPKRIPGSIIRYTLTVTNTGPGAVDASTLVMTDAIPTNTTLCVAASCGGVVEFVDAGPPNTSGLSFNYATNVTYSATLGGGAPFNHVATADAAGFDAAITGIRIAPTGTLAAAGAGNPGFSIRFYVKVN